MIISEYDSILCLERTGVRVVVDFEGHDAAGKVGMIRAIAERVSPRAFGLVALPAPSDRERTQIYSQRPISAIGSTMSLR